MTAFFCLSPDHTVDHRYWELDCTRVEVEALAGGLPVGRLVEGRIAGGRLHCDYMPTTHALPAVVSDRFRSAVESAELTGVTFLDFSAASTSSPVVLLGITGSHGPL